MQTNETTNETTVQSDVMKVLHVKDFYFLRRLIIRKFPFPDKGKIMLRLAGTKKGCNKSIARCGY